jgi:DNA mismatch repair ATPase MutL
MILKNLTLKETFLLLLTPVSFVSIFTLTTLLQGIKEFSFMYFNRPLFVVLVLLISIYVIAISKVIEKVFSQSTVWTRQLVLFIYTVLGIYYVSTFLHPAKQEVFFLNIFGMSLGINILLCLIIALIKPKVQK